MTDLANIKLKSLRKIAPIKRMSSCCAVTDKPTENVKNLRLKAALLLLLEVKIYRHRSSTTVR